MNNGTMSVAHKFFSQAKATKRRFFRWIDMSFWSLEWYYIIKRLFSSFL